MNKKDILIPVIGGIIVTLITGLIPNTPSMLVGATHYGYPLAWLTRLIIAPEYFPWRLNLLNLVADIIIWVGIITIILGALSATRRTRTK